MLEPARTGAGPPGTPLPPEVRPPEVRPTEVAPREGPDLSWGMLPSEHACWMISERILDFGDRPGLVTCKGPGYSPPEDLDRRLTVQFEPAIPVPETAVVTLPHGVPPDDSCVIRQRCRGAPIALHYCGFFSMFAIGNTLSDVMPNAEYRPTGEKVSVRGVLGVGALSNYPVGCEMSCCSQMFAPVVLAGATDVVDLQGLWCRGDESEVCCNAPAYGQTVIAHRPASYSRAGTGCSRIRRSAPSGRSGTLLSARHVFRPGPKRAHHDPASVDGDRNRGRGPRDGLRHRRLAGRL